MSLADALMRNAQTLRPKLEEVPALETRLAALLETARSARPTVVVAPERFLAYVGERLTDGDLDAALSSVNAADLYLACACVDGDREAIDCLERDLLSPASLYLDRPDLRAISEEVRQVLRVRLLVADDGSPPGLASYRGRGLLRGWLCTAAARVVVDLRRARAPAEEAEPDRLRSALADPELALMRADTRREFQDALAAALASLSAREATMLKLHFLDGLGPGMVGDILGVSERTTRRWLVDVRQKVLGETRRRLTERMMLDGAGLGEILGLVESQLDLSIRVALSKQPEPRQE